MSLAMITFGPGAKASRNRLDPDVITVRESESTVCAVEEHWQDIVDQLARLGIAADAESVAIGRALMPDGLVERMQDVVKAAQA